MFARRRYRHITRDVDRYGVTRYYFKRRRGDKKILMPDDPTSAEFELRHRELCGEAVGTIVGKELTGNTFGNTFRWLVDEYVASGTFKRLDKLTQDKRRQILDACRIARKPLRSSRYRGCRPSIWRCCATARSTFRTHKLIG